MKETTEALEGQMQEASEKSQFERAQEIHEMILSIQHIIDRQQIDFSDHLDRGRSAITSTKDISPSRASSCAAESRLNVRCL